MGLLEILMIHLLLLGQVFSVYHMLRFIAGNTAKKRGVKITRKESMSYGASSTVPDLVTKDTAGATGAGSTGAGSGAEMSPYNFEKSVEKSVENV